MNVVVFGGYGYIGGHLINELVNRSFFVKNLDSRITAKEWKFESSKYLSHIQASTTNKDAVKRALHKSNVVYFLADRTDNVTNVTHTSKILSNNYDGLLNVLTCCVDMGLDNFVYISSAEIYGSLLEGTPHDTCIPHTLNGYSKYISETLLRYFSSIMSMKILRLSEVWGKEFGYSYVDRFSRGNSPIENDGSQTRDFLFIEDAVTALISSRSWDDGIYNVGTGIETSISGIWKLLNQERAIPYSIRQVHDEIYRQVIDCNETILRTGWKPKTLLHELDESQVKELCK